MLERQRIMWYFVDDLATETDFRELQAELERNGFAPDVEPELQAAFQGYCTATPGEPVVPFARECLRLLELPAGD